MRNFKKFLALVLAMLMVSACAVSVSAYGDQAAIDATGYAKAVATLTNLGVIAGDGTNFNPDDTLTRAAAAKIVAMLDTGAAIKATTAAKPTFSDVPADHWGVPYINYVSQRGIMDGIGDGKFAPDAELTIAEAIVIAVKAAGKKAQVATLNEQIGVPTFWAANWISVADTNELTTDLPTYIDYTDLCSRAMFAQVGYNIYNKVAGIGAKFDTKTISAIIDDVTDTAVEFVQPEAPAEKIPAFAVGAFNEALKAAGIEFTAAELENLKVTVTYSAKQNAIIDIELDTDVIAADYRLDAINYVYDKDDNFEAGKINIAGTVYEFGVDDAAQDPTSIGGSIVAATTKVLLWIDGEPVDTLVEKETIPDFYKGIGYDDDGDMELDRVYLFEYELATAKADGKTKDEKQVNYKIGDFTSNPDSFASINYEDGKEVVWTGETAVLDGETPMLINKARNVLVDDKYVIDVLEVAATVKGQFTSYSDKNANITVGQKLSYLKSDDGSSYFADVDETLIGMTVSVYTINGKYVKFASASTSETKVIVDSADVVDGKLVVTGYNNANYAPITVTIDGFYDDIYKTGITEWNQAEADGTKYNTTLKLGYKDNDGNFQTEVTLTEGLVIVLKNIGDAVYYTGNEGTIAANESADTMKAEGKYFYKNDKAVKVLASSLAVLVEEIKVDKDGDGNYKWTGKYSDIAYSTASTFANKADVDYKVTVNSDGQVSQLFVKAGFGNVAFTTDYKNLEDGQSIVYVYAAAEDIEYVYGAATYTYKVIDLAKKEVVTITSDKALTEGHFYLVKDGKAGEDTTDKWISDDYNVTVEHEEGSVIWTVKADTVIRTYYSVSDSFGYAQTGDEAIYDLSNTAIYNLNDLWDDNDALKTVKYEEDKIAGYAENAWIFAVPGQLIIVQK